MSSKHNAAAERVARLIDFIKEIDQAAKFQAAKRLSQCGTDEEARDVLAQLEMDCEDTEPADALISAARAVTKADAEEETSDKLWDAIALLREALGENAPDRDDDYGQFD